MTISYSNFFAPTVLGTSAGTLATIPAQPTTTLLRGGRIRLTNTTGGAVTATLYAVPAAGSPAAGNAFVSGNSVAANDFLDVLSLIHISEPTRPCGTSRMPSSA